MNEEVVKILKECRSCVNNSFEQALMRGDGTSGKWRDLLERIDKLVGK